MGAVSGMKVSWIRVLSSVGQVHDIELLPAVLGSSVDSFPASYRSSSRSKFKRNWESIIERFKREVLWWV